MRDASLRNELPHALPLPVPFLQLPFLAHHAASLHQDAAVGQEPGPVHPGSRFAAAACAPYVPSPHIQTVHVQEMDVEPIPHQRIAAGAPLRRVDGSAHCIDASHGCLPTQDHTVWLQSMTSTERLSAVFKGLEPDRTPLLGGWIACPEHIAALAGVSVERYWDDPVAASITAYTELSTDGLLDIFVPKHPGGYRCVDEHSYLASSTMSLDEALRCIDAMAEPAEILRTFDEEAAFAQFADELSSRQSLCGDMVWMPAQWGAGARVSWYGDFGYQTFFELVGLYPGRAQRLMEIGGARGWCRSRVVARAVRAGLYPPAVLLGEDICTQRGPMLSMQFLESHYLPALRRSLEPLLEVGCRPVWHCDGDVRPMLDMLIEAGVQGFQGFQPECSMHLEDIVRRRTRDGNRLLIFGPLSVTTELPVLTAGEVGERVRRAIDVCRGAADLALFTANTINPDVPLENIRAMSEAITG